MTNNYRTVVDLFYFVNKMQMISLCFDLSFWANV